jgi:hypothetical protein
MATGWFVINRVTHREAFTGLGPKKSIRLHVSEYTQRGGLAIMSSRDRLCGHWGTGDMDQPLSAACRYLLTAAMRSRHPADAHPL